MPVIAIVGRPNVGKSSLLNALVNKRISIVQDMPGVTRDRVSIPMSIDIGTLAKPDVRWIELVDTGGFGFIDADKLTDHIRQQIDLAMAQADLVLFIVDCQAGLTHVDEEIAGLLRTKSIKTLLLANKADGPTADVALGEFAKLGLATPLGISALRDRNLDQVLVAIKKNLDLSDAPTNVPDPQMMVAIVGKRNAGKSTLVNAVAQVYEGDPQRVIVSEVPGTTRDSIDVRFEKDGKALIVIDTAGVRKSKHMATNDIEFYSFHRAQRSIRRADVVIHLIDGTEPVSEPDKKLARYIAEQFKPTILAINKWDLTREKARESRKEWKESGINDAVLMEEYRKYLDEEMPGVGYAPIAFITAKDGKNVQAVLDEAAHLFKQATERLTTGQLNRVVRTIMQERIPSTTSGRRARIYYATQTSVAPPTIVLFVNNPAYFDDAYRRFMVNRFRELLPYAEVPIELVIRGRDHAAPTQSLDDVTEESLMDIKDQQPKRAKRSSKTDSSAPRLHKAAGKRTLKSGPGVKPKPKKAATRGPQRGTRPKR